jgi:hypothetical protein
MLRFRCYDSENVSEVETTRSHFYKHDPFTLVSITGQFFGEASPCPISGLTLRHFCAEISVSFEEDGNEIKCIYVIIIHGSTLWTE